MLPSKHNTATKQKFSKIDSEIPGRNIEPSFVLSDTNVEKTGSIQGELLQQLRIER